MRINHGSASPLGARLDGDGVNFAISSEHATAIYLCLFDGPDAERERVAVPLTGRTGDVWHGHVAGLERGQLYGYRVFGPWNPAQGHRFNPAKVLFDPYALLVGRQPVMNSPTLSAHLPGTDGDSIADAVDNAAWAPLAAVADRDFDWQDDAPPAIEWERTVIYEVHVGGFTKRHPRIPERLRGSYAGLASAPAIDHLRRLGVTAVELLPVHAHADEPMVVGRGLVNYWGYNTLGFFAPDPRFVSRAPLEAVVEFKEMVRALHAAGIEVILDVVYNHSAEGNHQGPLLSLRGIDNFRAYRLAPGMPSRYEDFTGCGNTLDLRSAPMLQLVLDSLRYWVEEMHVDGFRFDLASALVRAERHVDLEAAFLIAIRADPVLSKVKLIAEPWDTTGEGYQVGRFPGEWSEWNDKYRDTVRKYWRGDAGMLPELATRVSGSRDLYETNGRFPRASVNFVTAHDGFTLADLVAYNDKHNEANGEENRDGHNDNASWNCGAEGPTNDPAILALRAQQRRNLFTTLLVSQGVPMMSGGDEVGRTQQGNNNAYCHDSPLTWTPWQWPDGDHDFLTFAQGVVALRASQPVLRRREFLKGRNGDVADVFWLRPDGQEMTDGEWQDPERRTVGMLLPGEGAHEEGAETVLILFNAGDAAVTYTVPPDLAWRVALDTAERPDAAVAAVAATFEVAPRSLAVLTARRA